MSSRARCWAFTFFDKRLTRPSSLRNRFKSVAAVTVPFPSIPPSDKLIFLFVCLILLKLDKVDDLQKKPWKNGVMAWIWGSLAHISYQPRFLFLDFWFFLPVSVFFSKRLNKKRKSNGEEIFSLTLQIESPRGKILSFFLFSLVERTTWTGRSMDLH